MVHVCDEEGFVVIKVNGEMLEIAEGTTVAAFKGTRVSGQDDCG